MPEKNNRIARVTHVEELAEGQTTVTLMIGDTEHQIQWAGTPPALGDIFLATDADIPAPIKQIGAAESGAWNMNGDAMRWRKRDAAGKSRMDVLHKRHIIRRAVRDYLDDQGFIEIDAPLLVHGTTPDAVINAFAVDGRYLSTSTEHQIKRLQVGGFEKLYTLAKNFRAADGEGSTHNPEFTMLEWDRVGGSLDDVERDAEGFFMAAHHALGGGDTLNYQGHNVDLKTPWARITVAEAIHRHTGVAMPDFELESIRAAAKATNIAIHDEWKNDRAFLFSILMDHLQQHIGYDRPTFVHEWPSFMTSMAPAGNSGTSARSELYICGLELSNGFPSVTNADEQLKGFEAQQERRRIEGKAPVMLDQRLLAAQRQGLPACTGMALGFDRLVMILTDQADIRATLAFAWDEV